ncbi:MAG: 3-deoxy-D-manno-octulosonic acid transferase [Synergistaceae bacterium]|jgi:3-deoxy-D-manno-octulosonic-acid transferase|nr:3-deoxy-D-manno-octulosonic acid transferase [Synergistaceae bacterium]
MSLALSAYRVASRLASPIIKMRLRRSDKVGFDERRGEYSRDKTDKISGGRTLWLHAVSVGEVNAASPFVRLAAGSGCPGAIVVSTVTRTGAAAAEALMGSDIAFHVYAPWDIPHVVSAACDALKPSAYITVETEVWPNILMEMRRRGVPTVLMNARISDRTMRRARFFKTALREAYELFDCVLARGEEDAGRLRTFGVDSGKISVSGDCKIDAIIQRRERASEKIPDLRRRLRLDAPDGVSCLVAGSTHEGEDEIVTAALSEFKRSVSRRALLIIAPRHPERADRVAAIARRAGRVAMYSELTPDCCDEPPDIVVVDVMGILYEMYGTADIVFVGGSLVPLGGQNVLEPASWGAPVLHGPDMDDFAAPTAEFDRIGAAHCVKNAGDIAEMWRMAEHGDLKLSAAAGTDYIFSRSGAAKRSWELIRPLIGGAG